MENSPARPETIPLFGRTYQEKLLHDFLTEVNPQKSEHNPAKILAQIVQRIKKETDLEAVLDGIIPLENFFGYFPGRAPLATRPHALDQHQQAHLLFELQRGLSSSMLDSFKEQALRKFYLQIRRNDFRKRLLRIVLPGSALASFPVHAISSAICRSMISASNVAAATDIVSTAMLLTIFGPILEPGLLGQTRLALSSIVYATFAANRLLPFDEGDRYQHIQSLLDKLPPKLFEALLNFNIAPQQITDFVEKLSRRMEKIFGMGLSQKEIIAFLSDNLYRINLRSPDFSELDIAISTKMREKDINLGEIERANDALPEKNLQRITEISSIARQEMSRVISCPEFIEYGQWRIGQNALSLGEISRPNDELFRRFQEYLGENPLKR